MNTNFRKIWYLPLESYKARYTMQWSAPKTGWLERNWIKAGVPYERIDGNAPYRDIKIGSVVDAVGRSLFSFQQVSRLLEYAEKGMVSNKDVVYIDDFWLPGFEAIPYVFNLLGIHPRIYAFLHAQTADRYDFTYPMRRWMRPIEKGFSEYMSGILVCCPLLKELVVESGIADSYKVHITGHPFSSEEVLERVKDHYVPCKEDVVIYSSRWDVEKNPETFLELARIAYEKGSSLHFRVCTSHSKIKSNSPALIKKLENALGALPNLTLHEHLSKEAYYQHLRQAKFQFNCASQDFVAITLLEAAVFGCYPIYPNFRSFPETFNYQDEYLYKPFSAEDAFKKILSVPEDSWTEERMEERKWLYSRFDTSWERQIRIFNGQSYEVPFNTL